MDFSAADRPARALARLSGICRDRQLSLARAHYPRARCRDSRPTSSPAASSCTSCSPAGILTGTMTRTSMPSGCTPTPSSRLHSAGVMPPPASNAEVSSALHRCLAPDPAARPSAAELRALLSGRNRQPSCTSSCPIDRRYRRFPIPALGGRRSCLPRWSSAGRRRPLAEHSCSDRC